MQMPLFSRMSGFTLIRLTLWDNLDTFMQDKTLKFAGIVAAFAAETVRVSEALSWIDILSLGNVTRC